MARTPEISESQAQSAQHHYARLAELQAYCHEQALADRRYTAAHRYQRDYRRAAHRCRLLGEWLRDSQSSRRPTAGRAADQSDSARTIISPLELAAAAGRP